jgi:hypothetical protein
MWSVYQFFCTQPNVHSYLVPGMYLINERKKPLLLMCGNGSPIAVATVKLLPLDMSLLRCQAVRAGGHGMAPT